MISIITCSIIPEFADNLSNNISNTIGDSKFEFILTDNRKTGKGICQVYNEAAEKAQGEILCFVHEDVEFKTKNWGVIIQKIVKEAENPGVIGVAGSTLISKTPAGWYNFHLKDENRFYLYQRGVDNNPEAIFLNINPRNEKISKVLAVDGVLMFVKKEVWKEYRFDQINFREFHYYDIDFSARIAEKYNNYISYNILIEHFSTGNINKSWIKNTLIFENKWRNHLPIKDIHLDPDEIKKEEAVKLIHLLSNMVKFKYSLADFYKYNLRFLRTNPIHAIKFALKRIL